MDLDLEDFGDMRFEGSEFQYVSAHFSYLDNCWQARFASERPRLGIGSWTRDALL